PQTAVIHCQNTPTCPGAFFTLHDLTSQDFRVGVRWLFPAGGGFGFGGFAQPAFAPAAPQYGPAPQPPYLQPPPPRRNQPGRGRPRPHRLHEPHERAANALGGWYSGDVGNGIARARRRALP